MAKHLAPLTEDERSRLVGDLLVFLAGRQEDLERLLTATGLSASNLPQGLGDSGFEHGLLDYLAQNEPLMLAFCAESGNDPVRLSASLARWAGGG